MAAGTNSRQPPAVQASHQARNRYRGGKASLDVPPGTLNAILKQAGLKKEKRG
jgi:hypothetical protein